MDESFGSSSMADSMAAFRSFGSNSMMGRTSTRSSLQLKYGVAKDESTFFIPQQHHLPCAAIARSLQTINAEEFPGRPGLLRTDQLLSTVRTFDDALSTCMTYSDREVEQRSGEIADIIEHLRLHTKRRWGQCALDEELIEWEHTGLIYGLFKVKLSIWERVFLCTDVFAITSKASTIVSQFLMLAIFVSTVVWIFSTLPSMQEIPERCRSVTTTEVGECAPEPHVAFQVVEWASVLLFTFEYLVRLLTVHGVRPALLDEKNIGSLLLPQLDPGEGRYFSFVYRDGRLQRIVRHVFGTANLIDLFAILPFWLGVFGADTGGGGGNSGGALVVLRVLRLARIFRVMKLGKYNDQFNVVSHVLRDSAAILAVLAVAILFSSIVFGMGLWYIEKGNWYPEGHPALQNVTSFPIVGRGAQLRHDGSPDMYALEESPYHRVFNCLWFVLVTVAAVGYGDFAPATFMGKCMGSVTILAGIVILSMPIGAIGANFGHEYNRAIVEKQRRGRAEVISKRRSAEEDEADEALSSELDLDASGSLVSVGLEFKSLNEARERILSNAQKLEFTWRRLLSPILYEELSRELRIFATELFADAELSEPMDKEARSAFLLTRAPPLGKPLVSLGQLNALDALTTRVHAAIAFATFESTNGSELVPEKLEQAKDCRRRWSDFCEECWGYVVEHCRVASPEEAGEYYEMKSELLHRTLSTINRRRKTKLATMFQGVVGRATAMDRLRNTVQTGGGFVDAVLTQASTAAALMTDPKMAPKAPPPNTGFNISNRASAPPVLKTTTGAASDDCLL